MILLDALSGVEFLVGLSIFIALIPTIFSLLILIKNIIKNTLQNALVYNSALWLLNLVLLGYFYEKLLLTTFMASKASILLWLPITVITALTYLLYFILKVTRSKNEVS